MRAGACVVLVVLCAAFAAAVPCGSWTQQCAAYFNSTYLSGTIQFNGLNAGDYTWKRNVYTNAACSSSYMTTNIVGSWIDMEFNNATSPTRWLYFTMEYLVVVPGSSAAASYLNVACPCGGQWIVGQSRNLSACSTSSCSDTQWLGGSPPASGKGITIGQPFYGAVQSPTWGLQGSLAVSYLDVNSLIGWNNGYPTLGNNYQGSACLAPQSSYALCGTWQEWCSPTNPRSPYDSITSILQYDGPVPSGGFVTPSAGIITQTDFMYADTACNVPFLTVMQTGTLAYQGVSTMPSAYTLARSVPGVQVTPHSPAAATYLNTECPCAGKWSSGFTRLLTQCPENTCNTTHWYHGATLGATNYVNMVVTASANFSEVRFTEFATTPSQVPTGFSSDGYPYEQTAPCQYSFGGSNFCGVWHQPCGSYNGVDQPVDLVKVLTVTGDPIVDGSGKFNRVRTFYEPGHACGDEMMIIEENGYWATDGFSNLTDGGYEFTLVVPRTTVTISNASLVAYMNTACPCRGTWVLNTPRLLTTCPTECDTSFFVAGDLGIPGFGTWRRYPSELRVSTLNTNEVVGFNTPLTLNDYAYNDVSFCPTTTPSNTFCGSYMQPCYSDSATTFDMMADVSFNDNSVGLFSLHRYFFLAGSGCPALGTPAINVTVDAFFENAGPSSVITGGLNIALDDVKIYITAYNTAGLQYLASYCPCNGSWVANQTRVLSSCPPNTCNRVTILRMPIANNAYGILQRVSGELRMNEFNETATVGYNTQFQETDYAYVDVMACMPVTDASVATAMPGGDVFLIILFVGIFVYLAGGIAYNYRKTGSVEIPNKQFWSEFPGLVKAGFRFTFVDMFGLRSSKAGYKDLETPKESYGTL